MSSRYHTKRQFKKRPVKGNPMPVRPKSFKSEAAATEWIKTHGFDKKGAVVEQIAETKFKIRMKV